MDQQELAAAGWASRAGDRGPGGTARTRAAPPGRRWWCERNRGWPRRSRAWRGSSTSVSHLLLHHVLSQFSTRVSSSRNQQTTASTMLETQVSLRLYRGIEVDAAIAPESRIEQDPAGADRLRVPGGESETAQEHHGVGGGCPLRACRCRWPSGRRGPAGPGVVRPSLPWRRGAVRVRTVRCRARLSSRGAPASGWQDRLRATSPITGSVISGPLYPRLVH